MSLGAPIGGNSVNIDGYDFFKDFGILISDVKLNDDIPGLKQSNTTVFNTSKPFTTHRSIKTIQMSCSIPFKSPLQLMEAIGKFKKMLSQNGMREVFYDGRGYSCFLSEGFNVKFRGRKLVKFNLRLNIATNFVELRFVESGFITGRIINRIMVQKNIRDFNGIEFSVAEAAEWHKEFQRQNEIIPKRL